MIIIPTRVCNTDTCHYCGVWKKDFEKKYFQDFSLHDFFHKVLLICEKTGDFELRFFGGEPFLKFETIKEIIKYFHEKDKRFYFTINTNLTLIDQEKINFVKLYHIKLIISCNGKIKTHSKSRGISLKKTLDLYKNIKHVTSQDISHQINIVVDNESAHQIDENLDFIHHYLGGIHINLLPVNYNGWGEKGLNDFEVGLAKVTQKIKSKELNIHFINKDIQNDVALFNNEFVIDSDGCVYPSMVILETFFQEEKNKILITNLSKEILEVQKDLHFFDDEYNSIYSQYINQVLQKKFEAIIDNDYKSSQIFHNFLQTI